MVSSAATTVTEYLIELPPQRRAVVAAVRDLVNAHIPDGYVETMTWGMIVWQVPLSRYPDTHNRQPLAYVALAAQKNAYSLYLGGTSDAEPARTLRAAYAEAGRKLDMGKSCLRFRKLDDLLMAPIACMIAGTPVDATIAAYEASRRK